MSLKMFSLHARGETDKHIGRASNPGFTQASIKSAGGTPREFEPRRRGQSVIGVIRIGVPFEESHQRIPARHCGPDNHASYASNIATAVAHIA